VKYLKAGAHVHQSVESTARPLRDPRASSAPRWPLVSSSIRLTSIASRRYGGIPLMNARRFIRWRERLA